jgi:hypothetical protein
VRRQSTIASALLFVPVESEIVTSEGGISQSHFFFPGESDFILEGAGFVRPLEAKLTKRLIARRFSVGRRFCLLADGNSTVLVNPGRPVLLPESVDQLNR